MTTATATPVRRRAAPRSPKRDLPLLTAAEEVELAKQVEAGMYAKHLLEVGSHTASIEDLEELCAQGNKAYDRMVRSNVGLVPFMARSYLGQGMDMEELIQEGMVGLVIAVQKFDYTLGVKFSSHACWWIRYALTTGTGNTGRVIRVPRHIHADINRFRKTHSELAVAGQSTSVDTVAQAMGLPEEKVAELAALSRPILSFDGLVESAENPDWIAHRAKLYSPSALDVFMQRERCRQLLDALGLNAREMLYLEMLYGVDTGQPRSKLWVQKKMGLQPAEASKIHARVESAIEQARSSEFVANF